MQVDENAGVATRQREGKAASTRALGKKSGRPGLSPRDGNGGLGGLGAAVGGKAKEKGAAKGKARMAFMRSSSADCNPRTLSWVSSR